MVLELSAALALAQQCAPQIDPRTLLPIIMVESGLDTLALGVNHGRRAPRAATPKEAAANARRLLAVGANLDLGLAQINSGNLTWLGLSVEDAFDPCRNLAAAARVLKVGYLPAAGADPQAALRQALSRYNTGDPERGFANGYVAKVEAAARALAPALASSAAPAAGPVAPQAAPPSRDVFARPSDDRRLVFAFKSGTGL